MKQNKSNNVTLNQNIDDFFHLVKKIEKEAMFSVSQKNVQFSAIGGDSSPQHEPLRFKASHSMAFSGSSIETLNECKNNQQNYYEMVVTFMGLTGPTGVLPQHYTRLIQERLKLRDTTFVDFLDMFNHRLISLFYRSWAKYRFSIQFENYLNNKEQDPFTKVLQSLSGQNPSQDHDAQLYYSGHFQRSNKTVSGLTAILKDFLQIPINIRSFTGQWLMIQERDRAVLSSQDEKRKQCLGTGVLLGKRYWDVQSKITIEFGPLSHSAYREYLPGGKNHRPLHRLLNSYVPLHLNVELLFIIVDTEGQHSQFGNGLKLGENCWLQSKRKMSTLLKAKMRLNRGGD